MMRSEEVFAELGGGGLGFNFFVADQLRFISIGKHALVFKRLFRVVCKICFGKPNHPAQTNS